MTNRRLTFSIAAALLLGFLVNFPLTEVKATTELPSSVSPEVQPDNHAILEEMENFLFKENGIMDQVNRELRKEGYKTRTALVYYSKEDVQLKFLLVDKEATESHQEKVKSIFFELIEKNQLDPAAFTIEVGSGNDGPDW